MLCNTPFLVFSVGREITAIIIVADFLIRDTYPAMERIVKSSMIGKGGKGHEIQTL